MKAMNDVSREYGSALYMVACEDDHVKTYIDGLNVVAESFSNEPEYILFLSSPDVPLNQRISSLEAVFGNVIPQKMVSFLQLLCEKGRIECFQGAKETFLELYEDWKHIMKITVKSAVPLTESEKERLANKLESVYKCSLRMDYVVDATIIGGVVIETEDKVIDGSVKSRLQQVKEVIER